MLNTYPIWKYLVIIGAVMLGCIYALPNVYPPDYAVQISSEQTDRRASDTELSIATRTLENAGISYFGAEVADNFVMIRVESDEAQLRARSLIARALHDAGGDWVVALNLAPTTPEWLASLGATPMKYGLDLRGGVHFLMEVDTQSTVVNRLEGLETDIKRKLREERIRYEDFKVDESGVLKITFKQEDARSDARATLENQYREFVLSSEEDQGFSLLLTMTDQSIREIEDFAVKQNVQTIRNRVNELGVSEPLVQKLGRNRIVVDLPGVQDTAEAKRILGKVATLQFHMEAKPDAPRTTTMQYDYEGRQARLEKRVILRGDRVVDAQVGFDPDSGMPQVNITLDGEGGELMHRATRHDIGRRMAVIFIETKTRDTYEMVNGEEVKSSVPYIERRVISLATVQAALGVSFRITGLTGGEARELALLLRSGALAADMFIVEERSVGASLGEENIKLGAISVIVGLGMVLLFMLFYYKVFGLAANIALMVNLVLLVALMSALSATLTLPGIAGIVLTVGMAVDANVLIFSRIKEELAAGMTPQSAINAGFERAVVTILDANITTLLVAVILYSIGTGAIKGFAVTLSLGIMTSMFTAIMGTRAIVNLIYGGRKLNSLAI